MCFMISNSFICPLISNGRVRGWMWIAGTWWSSSVRSSAFIFCQIRSASVLEHGDVYKIHHAGSDRASLFIPSSSSSSSYLGIIRVSRAISLYRVHKQHNLYSVYTSVSNWTLLWFLLALAGLPGRAVPGRGRGVSQGLHSPTNVSSGTGCSVLRFDSWREDKTTMKTPQRQSLFLLLLLFESELLVKCRILRVAPVELARLFVFCLFVYSHDRIYCQKQQWYRQFYSTKWYEKTTSAHTKGDKEEK